MSTATPDVHQTGPVTPPADGRAGLGRTTLTGLPGRLRRLGTGPADDPRWARPGLLVLLAGTLLLYVWDLAASGWANSFYSAAAQAGTKSWKAMLFGSLDAGNVITVDKPPASLWLMSLSGRLFGFSSWTMLLPQALLGVGTVALVHAGVKRHAGPGWGLLAGAALAVTPVAVLMFRFNNPDALLTFLLVLAVYLVLRAQESGATKWLVWAGVAIGFAFLTKTLQAFLILPPLTLVYLATGPGRLLRRCGQLLLAGAGVLVSAGWWVAIVQLTPASQRPYIGGSQHNSFLELTFGYNGFGRLTGDETGSVGGGFGRGGMPTGFLNFGGGEGFVTAPGGPVVNFQGPGGPGGPGGFSNGTGLFRMFDSEIGTQISWLLPAALVLLVGGLWAAGRAKRTDPARAALLGWGGSMLGTALVFSYMKGIFHPYYTVALAPLITATLAIGAGLLWRRRGSVAARAVLAAAVAVSGWWAFKLLDRTPDWNSWARYVVVAVAVLGAAALLAGAVVERVQRKQSAESAGAAVPEWAGGAAEPGLLSSVPTAETAEAATAAPETSTAKKGLRWAALAFGVIAGLLGPGAYAIATASTGHTGSIPSAGPGGMGPGVMRVNMKNGGTRLPGGFPGMTGGPNGQGNQNGRLPGGGPGGLPGGMGGLPGGGGQNGQFPGGVPGGGPGGTPQNGQNGGATGPVFATGGGPGNFLDASAPSKSVQALLTKDAGSFTWIAAAIGSQNAAGYQLATGDAVIAIGGFNTTDPAPTLAKFQEYVAQHKVHYFIGGGQQRGNGGADVGSQITAWVEAHYTAQTVDGVTLYDLSATPKA